MSSPLTTTGVVADAAGTGLTSRCASSRSPLWTTCILVWGNGGTEKYKKYQNLDFEFFFKDFTISELKIGFLTPDLVFPQVDTTMSLKDFCKNSVSLFCSFFSLKWAIFFFAVSKRSRGFRKVREDIY